MWWHQCLLALCSKNWRKRQKPGQDQKQMHLQLWMGRKLVLLGGVQLAGVVVVPAVVAKGQGQGQGDIRGWKSRRKTWWPLVTDGISLVKWGGGWVFGHPLQDGFGWCHARFQCHCQHLQEQGWWGKFKSTADLWPVHHDLVWPHHLVFLRVCLVRNCGYPINAFVQHESAMQHRVWFGRVPSYSNIADGPSRLDFEEVQRLGATKTSVNWELVAKHLDLWHGAKGGRCWSHPQCLKRCAAIFSTAFVRHFTVCWDFTILCVCVFCCHPSFCLERTTRFCGV